MNQNIDLIKDYLSNNHNVNIDYNTSLKSLISEMDSIEFFNFLSYLEDVFKKNIHFNKLFDISSLKDFENF